MGPLSSVLSFDPAANAWSSAAALPYPLTEPTSATLATHQEQVLERGSQRSPWSNATQITFP